MASYRDPDLLARDQSTGKARGRGPRPHIPAASRSSAHLVIRLPGEIDVTNASQVQAQLARATADGADIVIADATGTTFCDCAGISALIGASHQAATDGTRLLVAAGPAMLRMLSLIGM